MSLIFWRTTAAALLALLSLMPEETRLHGAANERDLALAPLESSEPPYACGTLAIGDPTDPQPLSTLADGEAVRFVQDPPIILPTHTGPVRLRDFVVQGDVPEVRFQRNDPTSQDGPIETWTRVGVQTIAGKTVSLFEPSWANSDYAHVLRYSRRGFDLPRLYWGAILLPGTDPPVRRSVNLRVGSTDLPVSHVTRIDDTVQFASHVVNLVIPDFGDGRLSSSFDFGERGAAKKFFEHFEDRYDSLAFVPQAAHIAHFNAFHRNVRNQVNGIGLSIYDGSRDYGSAGALQSIEVYPQAALPTHSTSNHEIAHQWGQYFDWVRLASVTAPTPDAASHTPLLFAGETLLGGVLRGTRRVRRHEDGSYEIERTPGPILQHPLELYAMGLLPVDRVPDVIVFEDQGQLGPGVGEPEPGRKITGGARTVTINDILGQYGSRTGPTPAEWRRATVVVSREGLLSQAEMDYWNFFAQRLEDPNRTGVSSYDGYVSFDRSTRDAVDLQTDITPKAFAKIEQRHEVDYPRIGRGDCRDVAFTDTLASRYRIGERARFGGRVTAVDRSDFHRMAIRFWKSGGTSSTAVLEFADVSRSGDFYVEAEFREGQQGLYALAIFLFWPDSGAQFARCEVTPIVVE